VVGKPGGDPVGREVADADIGESALGELACIRLQATPKRMRPCATMPGRGDLPTPMLGYVEVQFTQRDLGGSLHFHHFITSDIAPSVFRGHDPSNFVALGDRSNVDAG
jgi:hypothetical protein